MSLSKEDEAYEKELSLCIKGISTCPRKADVYYDKDMSLNRSLVLAVLGAYIQRGISVFDPIRCLDAIGGIGAAGLSWKKWFNDVAVHINESRQIGFDRIQENAKSNNLEVKVTKKDLSVLLHEQAFNFIFIDCYGPATSYLHAVFSNLPKNGILFITATDDASLYGKAPDATVKNYGGFLVKTFYAKELAVRLIVAAIARYAARANKGIQVLCSIAVKGFFSVVIQVIRGPTFATECLSKIRKLIHCNACECRAFYPNTIYPIENPYKLLDCSCHSTLPGKSACDLGPVWSGEIFDIDFLNIVLTKATELKFDSKVTSLVETLIAEAKCIQSESSTAKRPKLDIDFTPPFYYNLHRHSPKGKDLLRTTKAVDYLHQSGFRASRTHFDPEAVRTSATLPELITVLQKCAKSSNK